VKTVYYSIITIHVFFIGFMALNQKEIYLNEGKEVDKEKQADISQNNKTAESKISVVDTGNIGKKFLIKLTS
jgi:hypothetical protein